MQPAFSSTKQAAVFAALLLVLLWAPVLAGKKFLPPREEIYASAGWATGPYPYIRQQIFEEKGDIDIAFVGSSLLMEGIDTPYIQKKLSEKLGRPAIVRTISWGGSGFDALYLVTHDLLEHRKVHMLVFADENDPGIAVRFHNTMIPYWFRLGDNAGALARLPLELKMRYYFASILGLPENLLCLVRSNNPASTISPEQYYETYHAQCPFLKLGSLAVEAEYTGDGANRLFAPYKPVTPTTTSNVCIYQGENTEKFEFPKPSVPAWRPYFAQLFARLAQEHQAKLVLMYVPVLAERRASVIRERQFWPQVLAADVTMMGIPPAEMFAGLPDEDVFKLYSDQMHLNKNGQTYFTPLIAPALLQTYENQR